MQSPVHCHHVAEYEFTRRQPLPLHHYLSTCALDIHFTGDDAHTDAVFPPQVQYSPYYVSQHMTQLTEGRSGEVRVRICPPTRWRTRKDKITHCTSLRRGRHYCQWRQRQSHNVINQSKGEVKRSPEPYVLGNLAENVRSVRNYCTLLWLLYVRTTVMSVSSTPKPSACRVIWYAVRMHGTISSRRSHLCWPYP